MKALVTRPREDSQGLAAELARLGFEVQVEPLLDIRAIPDVPVDTAGIQGILATSANGIRALARAVPDRHWPVWAVGDASARVARDLGYTRVASAGGDVESLTALVGERCDPAAGDLLHAAGSVTAGDLAGGLGKAGFTVRRVVLYRAETAGAVSDGLAAALAGGELDVALFFSPRTAATFVTLVQAAGLATAAGRIAAYALSPAVARELAALPWAAVHVAAAPTQAALLAALCPDSGGTPSSAATDRGPPMTETEAPKPAEAPAPPVAEPAARPSSPWLAIGLAVTLAAMIAAGAATFDEWKTLLRPPAPLATVAPVAVPADGLRSELTTLRERLAQLESRPGPAGGDAGLDARLTQAEAGLRTLQAQPAVPARLSGEVEELSRQVADLKRSSADAAAVLRLADRLERMESRLHELESRRGSAVALLLAVGQLREALAASLPFDAELRAVKALAGDDAEVARTADILRGRAAAGLPTRTVLAARFHGLAPAIIRADSLPEERTWWRQTLERLATLVTVRREDGDTVGDDAAARVARAAARLGDGDLSAAIAELSGLEGGPAAAAAPWLTDARDRLAADRAVSELTAHVVAAVGVRP